MVAKCQRNRCSDYIRSKNLRKMLNSFDVAFYHLILKLNHSINFVCVENNLKDKFLMARLGCRSTRLSYLHFWDTLENW